MLLFLVLLGYALQGYYWVLIASVLLSWIPELRNTGLYRIIRGIADPYMRLFRGLLVFGMMDFTPIIGFLLYSWGLQYYWKMVDMIAEGATLF